MRRQMLGLSRRSAISTSAAKLLVVACMLLCVSSASAMPFRLQTASGEMRQEEVIELKPGQVNERELAAGKAHAYRVVLASGQYLNIVVEQLGINVEVVLFDPKGEKVDSKDWWWREGAESLWALAESSGDYRLEISAPTKPTETGNYRVKIEKIGEWQQASETDKNVVTAHKKFGEGERLRAQGTAESQRQAIEKYKEALELWRALKDVDAEAETLNALGIIYYQLGDLKKSAEHIGPATGLFRTSGNRRGEADSLNTLSVIYNFSGEPQKALDIYNQALPLARAIKHYNSEVGILAGLGLVLNRLGQTQKAIETLNELVSLSRATGIVDGEAVAHNNLGLIYVNLGRFTEAIQHYSQTLSLLKVTGDRFGQATALNNIGNAYARMGEFQQAQDFLFQGLNLKRLIGDRRGEAANLGSIGNLHIRLEDYPTARRYYEECLSLSRAIGDLETEGVALLNLGAIYGRTGDLQKALEYLNQSLSLHVKLGLRPGEAAILTNLGSVYSRLGDPQKALDYNDKALKIRREIGDRYGESQTLSVSGIVYAQLGNQQKALEYLTQALTLARSTGDRLGEASTLYQLARIERGRGNTAEARSQIEAALEIVESTRTKVSLANVRAIYFAPRQEMYDFYIDLLMHLHRSGKEEEHLADALRANERRRARSLLDSLSEARANIRAGISLELLERERRLQQDLNVKADQQVRLLSRKHTAEQAEALAKEIEALTSEYEQALTQIRQSSPRYAALTQPQPLSLKEIQQQVLDEDTLLLEYALGEERSYVWSVTPTSITSFELPKRVEIESAGRRVYELLTTRNQEIKFETPEKRRERIARADVEYSKAAAILSEMLLGPVKPQMKNKRLLIVADGILQYLPFAALPSPEETRQVAPSKLTPLVADHEVICLPSASTLGLLRRELAGRQPAPKIVAVLADPVFDKDDERVKISKAKITTAKEPVLSATGRTDAKIQESELTRSVRDFGLPDEMYFPRLPSTRREAEAIVTAVPPAYSMKAVDFAANKATAGDVALGQYRYIHFATHALINSTHPELSGIVLSLVDQQGKDQDGFLVAHEIYNLKLPAEMVVLSSCKTGLGKEIKGEGLIGLTRGFLYAGTARVLVSLWDVNDESTAELMKRLYSDMLGKQRLSPAAALRAAQLYMWKSKRWQSPYHWAAFVLQGEYK